MCHDESTNLKMEQNFLRALAHVGRLASLARQNGNGPGDGRGHAVRELLYRCHVFRPGIYPPQFPLSLKRGAHVAISILVAVKWGVDRLFLPLENHDWTLYLDIHVVSAIRLRRFPNLLKPKGFNDQMKWLMLFDQDEIMPLCVDKVAVRDLVSAAIGKEFLIPLRVASESWQEVGSRLHEGPGVLKCSHDSGSAALFDKLTAAEIEKLETKFRALGRREYGVGKGEWMYKGVRPQFLIEERLSGRIAGAGPADIKVHCVDGQPKLIHVIEGRQTVQEQAFFSPEGTSLHLRVKPHRKTIADLDITPILQLVLGPASKLAAPFKYVRVDMYVVENRCFFGELSFHEQSGLFKNKFEERDLAAALGIKCSNPRKTIHNKIGSRGIALVER